MHAAESTALWDEERLRVVREALAGHAQFWAGQLADMDLPEDLSDAFTALGELRHCLGALRDFGS